MNQFFYRLENILKEQISRRTFLKIILSGLLILISQNAFLKWVFAKQKPSGPRTKREVKTPYDLVAIEGKDPYQNTVRAVEALGGMSQFVRKGDIVVVKPNMAWDRTPEQAANTEPQVVAALVALAYQAGAKRVNVFDVACNDEKMVYERSGIRKAALEKGALVYFPNHWDIVKARFPYKSPMENWPILRDAIDCDVFINVPVVKHHRLATLTLSMKNLMGVCSGVRGLMHIDIGEKLVDLTDYIKPELTVMDATRVLLRNGPSGGNVEDVAVLNKVFASTDYVLADAYGAALMKQDPMSISYIRIATERNLGLSDLSKANIFEKKV
ncbi:MAG TPA: DUF362 domain-containing protein [Candidatus Omnitrophota bacterium]|nr:DUF362 domain-containing protein [Candidatus Omnitrophota bacterium]